MEPAAKVARSCSRQCRAEPHISSHQSDVSLELASSEHHRISTEGEIGGAQFLHIKVGRLVVVFTCTLYYTLGGQQETRSSKLHLPPELP